MTSDDSTPEKRRPWPLGVWGECEYLHICLEDIEEFSYTNRLVFSFSSSGSNIGTVLIHYADFHAFP